MTTSWLVDDIEYLSRLQSLVTCLWSKLFGLVERWYVEQREEGELLCGKGRFWICGVFPHIL